MKQIHCNGLKFSYREKKRKEKIVTWSILLENSGKNSRVPDFVFLAHVVDMSSAMHAPFVTRSVSSMPYYTRIHLKPFLPISFLAMLIMWAKSKTFLNSFYYLRDRLHQTWIVPRFGFQVCRNTAKILFKLVHQFVMKIATNWLALFIFSVFLAICCRWHQ